MAEKKMKRDDRRRKPQPTVQHESSADSRQNIGTDNPLQAKQGNRGAPSQRKKHNGSDGAD